MANSGETKHHRSRLILSRRLPEKDATNARAKVCCPSNGKRLNVERSFLKPRRGVGDENERAETDLATLNHPAAGNHDDRNRKNRNLTKKSLRHLPHGGRQLSWF